MSPYYLLSERLLRHNLATIQQVAQDANVNIILAFKAYALWKTFPIFRQYITATTASSPYEARLAYELFGNKCHTYSPAYEDDTFADIVRCSSHITFNSLTQHQRFHLQAQHCSLGLRVNPEYSEIGTLLYNPCAPGSRFGLLASQLPQQLPSDIQGFHIHCHCESQADTFVRTLQKIEEKFSPWFPQLQWINFGGGHLMTHKDYDRQLLIDTLNAFHQRHPHLQVILEPGSAFAWETGALHAQVVDIVANHGITTAILNVSFTCHMPDCLEMPYMPKVRRAQIIEGNGQTLPPNTYRLGGNSCLSGDFMGYWQFAKPLSIGDEIIFEDMLHYTTVKTNMFNGIHHPDIAIEHLDGTIETLRRYAYEDYRDRMD